MNWYDMTMHARLLKKSPSISGEEVKSRHAVMEEYLQQHPECGPMERMHWREYVLGYEEKPVLQ